MRVITLLAIILMMSKLMADPAKASWYLHLDWYKNRHSATVKALLERHKQQPSWVTQTLLTKELSAAIEEVTFYGAEVYIDYATMVASGKFQQKVKAKLIEKIKSQSGYRTHQSPLGNIYQWNVDVKRLRSQTKNVTKQPPAKTQQTQSNKHSVVLMRK